MAYAERPGVGIDIFKGCEAPISALCARREPHLGRCYRGSNIACSTLCLTSFCTNFPTANRDADKNQLVALTTNKMSIDSQRHSFSEAESTAQQSLGSSTSIVPFCSRQICTSTPDFKKKGRSWFSTDMALEGLCMARPPQPECRRRAP